DWEARAVAENGEKSGLQHRQLHGIEEYREALDVLVGMARQRLRIFDSNLEERGHNSPRSHDLLRTFLLGNRGNRLEIVLHDTDYLIRYCPRMLSLLKQFSHAVTITETTSQAKGVYDPFAVADQACYVHRFHYDAPQALLALHDVGGAHALNQRFEELKEASGPALSATTLGL
ncbi:MAG: hypothetical protein ACM3JK_05440, partial [Betaproteobacteria bacterium]